MSGFKDLTPVRIISHLCVLRLVLDMSCKYLMSKVALEMQSPCLASGKRIVNICFNTASTV